MSDTTLTIGGDAGGAKQAADQTVASVKNITDAIQQFGGQASGDVDKASASWKSFVDGFNVKDAIENPLATVKDGLLGMAGSLGPVGVAIAGVTTTVAALGAGMLELAEHTRAIGSQLANMSLSLNISVPALSNLKFAMDAAGGSLDDVNRAVFMFSQRMENSSATVEKGLKQIGLSITEINKLSPDEQFYAISTALRESGENTNKAAVAMDLFGKTGRDMLPLLMKDLEGLRDKSVEVGATWNEEDAMAAKKFSGEMRLLQTETDVLWTKLGLHLSMMEQLTEIWAGAKYTLAEFATGLVNLASGFGVFSAMFGGKVVADMKATGQATKDLQASQDALANGSLPSLTMSELELKHVTEDLNKEVAKSEEANKKAAASLEAYNTKIAAAAEDVIALQHQAIAAQQEVGKEGLELKIAQLDAEQQKEEDAWQKKIDAGQVSAEEFGNAILAIEQRFDAKRQLERDKTDKKDLDNAQKTSDGIVKIHEQALDAEDQIGLRGLALQLAKLNRQFDNEAAEWNRKLAEGAIKEEEYWQAIDAIDRKYTALGAKARTDAENKTNLEIQKLEDETAQIKGKSATNAADAQIAQINRWYAEERDKAHAAGTDTDEYLNRLADLARAKTQEVIDAHDQMFQSIHKMLADLTGGPGGFADTFADTLAHTHSFADAFVAVWKQVKKDVEDIFASLLKSLLDGFLSPLQAAVEGVGKGISNALIKSLGGTVAGGGNAGASGSILGALGGLLGIGGGSGAAAGVGGVAASIGAAETAAGYGTATAVAGTAGGTAAAGGGIMASVGGFMTNPWTIGIGAAILGVWGLSKLLGGKSEAALTEEVRGDWLKSIGQEGIDHIQNYVARGLVSIDDWHALLNARTRSDFVNAQKKITGAVGVLDQWGAPGGGGNMTDVDQPIGDAVSGRSREEGGDQRSTTRTQESGGTAGRPDDSGRLVSSDDQTTHPKGGSLSGILGAPGVVDAHAQAALQQKMAAAVNADTAAKNKVAVEKDALAKAKSDAAAQAASDKQAIAAAGQSGAADAQALAADHASLAALNIDRATAALAKAMEAQAVAHGAVLATQNEVNTAASYNFDIRDYIGREPTAAENAAFVANLHAGGNPYNSAMLAIGVTKLADGTPIHLFGNEGIVSTTTRAIIGDTPGASIDMAKMFGRGTHSFSDEGIVHGPTMAQIADTAEKELILKPSTLARFANAATAAGARGGDGFGGITVNMAIDARGLNAGDFAAAQRFAKQAVDAVRLELLKTVRPLVST